MTKTRHPKLGTCAYCRAAPKTHVVKLPNRQRVYACVIDAHHVATHHHTLAGDDPRNADVRAYRYRQFTRETKLHAPDPPGFTAHVYGLDLKRISLLAGEHLLGHGKLRTVALNTITTANGDTATVSTVFLVIDHAFGYGDPILWETMTFGGPRDQHQTRYTTRAAALIGHQEAVNETRAALAAAGAR